MPRINHLYTHLITNRRAEIDGWLDDYRSFVRDVAQIRDALTAGIPIRDPAAYIDTTFAGVDNPWLNFAKQLLYAKSNGVASRGQSVLSNDNFQHFIGLDFFVTALAILVREPNRENFIRFADAWENARVQRNANRTPLLINRTLAACTPHVSSTVNESDFETVYTWLDREGFIERLVDADWYLKNVQVMEFLRQSFAKELASGETDEQLLSMFVWYLCKNIANPFTLKKQVIKYGAPGTGKTFTAKRDAKLLFNIWRDEFGPGTAYTHDTQCEVVQFHPSFGYEEFMEGLRPVLDVNGQVQLTLQNGVFKRICMNAAAWELDVYRLQPELAKTWETLSIQDLLTYRDQLAGEHWRYLFEYPHTEKKVADVVPPFFFIVDEINRAELSRVLGELMFCLEYRGTPGVISTQYSVLNTESTGMLSIAGVYKFFVPHNVYLIGTMNTIDRSVESFDLALRRRFRWERLEPDIAALRYHLKHLHDRLPGAGPHPWLELADDLAKLNASIKETEILGPDYEIGHAYLMDLRYPEALTRSEVREKLWTDSISPLLEEYLRGSGHADTQMESFRKAFGVL